MIGPKTILAALVSLALILPAGQGRADSAEFKELLERAQRISAKGANALALELYLKALDHIAGAPKPAQDALILGTFQTCRKLLDQGTVEPAVRGLMALLPPTRAEKIKPASVPGKIRLALEGLAMDLVLKNNPKLAIPALKALMADNPGEPIRWALMVRSYLEAGEFTEAEESLRRAVTLYPKAPELFFVRAALAGALSRQAVTHSNYARAESLLQEAARDLEQAAKQEPKMAGVHRALGKVRSSLWIYYRATGRHRRALSMLMRAEDAYSDAAHFDPDNPEIAFELGNLLFAARDWIASGQWFKEALRRYRKFLGGPAVSPGNRAVVRRNIDRCLHNLASTYHNQALDAHNLAQFDRANRLVKTGALEVPAYATESDKLLEWILARRLIFDKKVRRLSARRNSADALVQLGDLMMQVRDFARAWESYQRAAGLPPGHHTPGEIRDRVFGTRVIDDSVQTARFPLGSVLAVVEAPGSFDMAFLSDLLQRAHALTMGQFPHRLKGPLDLKVFANRRAFLEQAGPRVSAYQGGCYVLGRVLTFHEPGRSRSKWLEILVHEITHRYVDELSYANAPRWLAEGMAVWTSRVWTSRETLKMQKFLESGRLTAWDALDRRFNEHWNDPLVLDILYLQAWHMVRWLVEQYDHQRVILFLASLRTGQPPEVAMQEIFQIPAAALEQNWRQALK